MGIAALILGIISLLVSLTIFLDLSLILGVLAIVLGIISVVKKKSKGLILHFFVQLVDMNFVELHILPY